VALAVCAQVMWRQMAASHTWFSLPAVYSSRKLPRPVRVLMIEASILTLMFFTALVFNLAYPDPHPCSVYEEGDACMADRNWWDREVNTCRWSAYCLKCFYADPVLSVPRWVWLSVLATVLSSLFHTWVLKPIVLGAIVPPTKKVRGLDRRTALHDEEHSID
jgi:hypothetical protein